MLTFRKILLYDYLYLIFLALTILLTIFRLSLPLHSSYSIKDTTFEGILTKKIIQEEKITLYIKKKESVIAIIHSEKKKEIESLHLGDTIKVEGLFQKFSKNTSPNLWNQEKYYSYQKIFFRINVTSYQIIKKNSNLLYRLKEKIIDSIQEEPYLSTFLLGEKSYLSSTVKRSYQENGISHLFAISGMHISLIASIINRILKRKLSEKTIIRITSIVLIGYLGLTGMSPSIVRGVLFYLLFSLNRMYYFYIKPVNLFYLILSIALLGNPYYIFDVGFLYSYSISFFLIIKSKDLSQDTYIKSLLKVSILSFFGSLPITLYSFHQINILSIFYNIIFVPLISFIAFPLSLIVFFIRPFLPIFQIIMNLVENLSLFLNNISFGKLIFKRLPFVIYILYFILFLLGIHTKSKKFQLFYLILLGIHYLIPIIFSKTYGMVIDVDQGDSILLHQNRQTILIDTGGIRKITQNGFLFYNTLSPTLKSLGISTINTLILTHGDYDHMGEAINLVNNFKVEKVIFNCGPYNDLEKKLMKVLDKKHINYYSCIKELNIDNNKLYFLQTEYYDNENDNSNVIYTELDGYKFMFMGDASSTTEKEIIDKYNLPDIDVLKVGHHGSKTSSSKEFINEINPKYSIISVGKNNQYGHPNKEVLNNLQDSKIYRTDQDGSIMFKIKNNKLKIETCSP